MRQIAVLTGDIVKSTEMPAGMLENVFASLSAAAQHVETWQRGSCHFTRNRGDGWQMAVEPGLACRSVLAARAAVRMVSKRADTRVALAIGSGEIPGTSLSDANGPAFVKSGLALEQMKHRRTLAFAESDGIHAISFRLAEEIIARWTEAQAQVALLALPPSGPTHQDIADELGTSRQTVSGHFEAGSIDALIEMCDLLDGRISV